MSAIPLASSSEIVALPIAILIVFVVGYWLATQKLCQYCGYQKNAFKSNYPVCQQCGRNRVTGGAGPDHE